MLPISWEPLPVGVAVAVLLIAAACQAFAHRVPNALTIPAILAGWVYSIHLDTTHQATWPGAAFQASFFGAFLALVILLPLYGTHRLGAGCVKAQMAFGAWNGCALPLFPSLVLTAAATTLGLAFTYFVLHRAITEIPDENRADYQFPAQLTMSVVATVGLAACWLLLHST